MQNPIFWIMGQPSFEFKMPLKLNELKEADGSAQINEKINQMNSMIDQMNLNSQMNSMMNQMNLNSQMNSMMNQMNLNSQMNLMMNQMNLNSQMNLNNQLNPMICEIINQMYIGINENINQMYIGMNEMNNQINPMMNQINMCDYIQIVKEDKRDEIKEKIGMNQLISIDETGKNKLIKKLISLCEIYGQLFPTQNFDFSSNDNNFPICLNKKNRLLYIVNMLNGINKISKLKTNIFIDLLNQDYKDNNNNILDEEYLLDLARKNCPEYLIFSVNNYIREIELGYQIIDSEYSKIKNKLMDLLNKFQSKYFNELKLKEFNSNMEILTKLIKDINNNENLKKSCRIYIPPNVNNTLNLYSFNENIWLNKFLIKNKDEIDIYKERLKSNNIMKYINKIGELIYKIQSLYIYEVNSKNLSDIRYEINQLLIQLYFKINSIFYYYVNKIVLVSIRYRIINYNIINFYELIENIKNCPKKIKDILNKVILYIEREKFTMIDGFHTSKFYVHKENNNKYYNLIEQLIVCSQMKDNEKIINNIYEAIIFIYELNEKKNNKSIDDKEKYYSLEIIKKIINLVRIYEQIFLYYFSSIDSKNIEEKIDLSYFFNFSKNIFNIMKILGYEIIESNLQFFISFFLNFYNQ